MSEPEDAAATPGDNEASAQTSDPASAFQMPDLGTGATKAEQRGFNAVLSVPVTLSVELGSTRMTIAELLQLANGSIVELDGYAGEPMNILVNGTQIAQGEVVTVEDRYAVRITSIADETRRMKSLSQ